MLFQQKAPQKLCFFSKKPLISYATSAKKPLISYAISAKSPSKAMLLQQKAPHEPHLFFLQNIRFDK
jgi:hypothetical protein